MAQKDVRVEGDTLIISLPGSPAGEVSGPSYMTWGMQKFIGSACQKENQYGLAVDLAKQLDATIQSWAAQEETRGFVRNRKGQLIPFDTECIDREASVDDISLIALRLCQHFHPSTWPTQQESPEGNAPAPSETDSEASSTETKDPKSARSSSRSTSKGS